MSAHAEDTYSGATGTGEGLPKSPGWEKALLFCLSVMVGLLLETQNSILKVLTSPLLLEFVLGCHLARLVNKRNIPSRICYILIAGGPAAVFFSRNLGFNVELRLIVWGIPAFFLATGCVFLEKNGIGFIPGRQLLTMLGGSSYSTYLTHTFVVLCVSTMLKRKLIFPVSVEHILEGKDRRYVSHSLSGHQMKPSSVKDRESISIVYR